MPKRRTITPAEALSKVEWKVHDDYVLTPRERITNLPNALTSLTSIEPTGQIVESKTYRLDIEVVQDQLLEEFIGIHNEKDSLEFVRRRGLPCNPSEYFGIEELLRCANSVRWLAEVIKTIQYDEGLITHWVEDVTNLQEKGTEAPNCRVFTLRPTKGEIDWPLVNELYLSRISDDSAEQSCWFPKITYPDELWETHGKKAPVYIAYEYLIEVFNRLLLDIEPVIEFQVIGKRPAFEQKLKVTCPWEAICYALTRMLTKNQEFANCLVCNKQYSRKRRHRETCGDTCYRRLKTRRKLERAARRMVRK